MIVDTMGDFKKIPFGSVKGGATSACQRLPDSPAIYAFFAPAPSVSTMTPKSFVKSVLSLVQHKASPTHTRAIGSLHKVSLDNQSDLSRAKQDSLDEQAKSEHFRNLLADIIAVATPLRSPLYVGQTASLRRRIREHLDPGSGLAVRLRSAEIQIEECTLAYQLMPDSDLYRDEQTLVLIEEVVTRLVRPGFVSRIG